MSEDNSASSVVVGFDGPRASFHAAVRAVDEAVSRDVPLRLVYVVDPADFPGADVDDAEHACARAALSNGQRMLEAAGKPVKVETEVVYGRPVAALVEASRWATVICVGSLGVRHARRRPGGSIASVLAGSAHCPVAVVGASAFAGASGAGWIVAQVDESPDNDAVLRWALDEARLRTAPVRAVASWRANVSDDAEDESRLAQAQLDRRIVAWARRYTPTCRLSRSPRAAVFPGIWQPT